MILPELLCKEEETPIENKIEKLYNPKTIKQIVIGKINLNDKKTQ